MKEPRFNCKETSWQTPEYVLAVVKTILGDDYFDPAPVNGPQHQSSNCSCGLCSIWSSKVFINPPYGSDLKLWLLKIKEEAAKGHQILSLLPVNNRIGTEYFQSLVFNQYLTGICFVRGRINFISKGKEKSDNLYDSAIYAYNCRVKQLSALGAVVLVQDIIHSKIGKPSFFFLRNQTSTILTKVKYKSPKSAALSEMPDAVAYRSVSNTKLDTLRQNLKSSFTRF